MGFWSRRVPDSWRRPPAKLRRGPRGWAWNPICNKQDATYPTVCPPLSRYYASPVPAEDTLGPRSFPCHGGSTYQRPEAAVGSSMMTGTQLGPSLTQSLESKVTWDMVRFLQVFLESLVALAFHRVTAELTGVGWSPELAVPQTGSGRASRRLYSGPPPACPTLGVSILGETSSIASIWEPRTQPLGPPSFHFQSQITGSCPILTSQPI